MPELTVRKSQILTLITIVLTVVFLPFIAEAGVPGSIAVTDDANSRLIGYWDLRDRESYFQVTNESGTDIRVHIQIFDVGNDCVEFDYYDTLTPRDTHLYDVSSLDRNNGAALSAPDLSGGHGIIAVTHVENDDFFNPEPVLTGNFRIMDQDGYQYRTNFAGDFGINGMQIGPPFFDFRVNFNDVTGATLSDVVLISVNFIDDPGGVEPFSELYEVTLYDEHENAISCPPVVLGCFDELLPLTQNGEPVINVGINQSVTNSRGGPSLCLGTDTTGFLELSTGLLLSEMQQQSLNHIFQPHHFVFAGLNNGNGKGSMDSALQEPFRIIAIECGEDFPCPEGDF